MPEWPAGQRHAYFIGNGDGLILPGRNITRAEVATIFFRLIPDDTRAQYWSQTNAFADVDEARWFNNAISTMTHQGLIQGRPDGSFAPAEYVTRAEFAATIVRHMGYTNVSPTDVAHFTDVSATHWASGYINIAANHGWVVGRNGIGSAFEPTAPITRAEAAALINRIFNRVPASLDDMLPNMLTWPDNANPTAWYYAYIQSASNSYTFEIHEGFEVWGQLLPIRDWSLLERAHSTPHCIFN